MPTINTAELDLTEIAEGRLRGQAQIYNGFDCLMLPEIEAALDKIPQHNQLIYRFELGLQAPALEMMLRGFLVDPLARENGLKSLRAEAAAAERILNRFSNAIWNKDLNPNSPKQIRGLLYDTMGIPPVVTHHKGIRREPMDRAALEKLTDYFLARPIINAILLCRDIYKTIQMLETEVDDDWRWRCSYNIGGTTTGRWSSSKFGDGTGNNFQNIRSDWRKVFIADPGYIIWGFDKEQAEAREVGLLLGLIFDDWKYLDAVEAGDVHTYVCTMAWPKLAWTGDRREDRKIADRSCYRHLSYRDIAKRLSHGSNYLGQPSEMAKATKIPEDIASAFQEAYFGTFPAIPAWHRWTAEQLQTKHYLVNSLGRRRDFFDRPDSKETIRAAVAYQPQSATADDINLGLWRLWHKYGTRVQLLAQLHDAVYFQALETESPEEIIALATESLVPIRHYPNRTFSVPIEAKCGKNWAPRWRLAEDGTKIDVNPAGLDKPKL